MELFFLKNHRKI